MRLGVVGFVVLVQMPLLAYPNLAVVRQLLAVVPRGLEMWELGLVPKD